MISKELGKEGVKDVIFSSLCKKKKNNNIFFK